MTWRVPLQDLGARHARTGARVEEAVLGVLRSGRYVGGPVLEALEGAVSARMDRRHGVGVSCGTEALVLALQAVGVRPGDEVIVPAVSFFATGSAVVLAGAVPVPVDVLPDRPLLDPTLARSAVTRRTRAVIVVHLFGDVAPHPSVDVPVIDDAAQAFGVPTKGVCATLSFYPTKVLAGAGEGGMVLTNDPEMASALRLLRNHGMIRPHEAELVETAGGRPPVLGRNARMDAIQAAIVLANLEGFDLDLARRRFIASRYDDAFGSQALARSTASPVSSYLLRHPARDALQSHLTTRGIESQVVYPKPLSDLLDIPAEVPEAHRFCREALALPCHAELTASQVDLVIAAVQGFDP